MFRERGLGTDLSEPSVLQITAPVKMRQAPDRDTIRPVEQNSFPPDSLSVCSKYPVHASPVDSQPLKVSD